MSEHADKRRIWQIDNVPVGRPMTLEERVHLEQGLAAILREAWEQEGRVWEEKEGKK